MILALLLTGCDADPASQCSPTADPGTLSATLDGEDWLGEGLTWRWSGDSVQLTTAGTDRITAVGHSDADGTAVADLLDSLPATISLDDDAGWAVLYQGDESTRSVSGSLLLAEHTDDGTLTGCLDFEADNGSSLSGGMFSADDANN